jgi:hypothetical protein
VGFNGWADADGELMVDFTGADAAGITSAPTRHRIKTNATVLFMVHEIFSRIINAP